MTPGPSDREARLIVCVRGSAAFAHGVWRALVLQQGEHECSNRASMAELR